MMGEMRFLSTTHYFLWQKVDKLSNFPSVCAGKSDEILSAEF